MTQRSCVSSTGRWILYHCTTWGAHILPCLISPFSTVSIPLFSSVTQFSLTFGNPMNHSTPGLPLHPLPEFIQTHPLSRWCHLTISSSVIPFSCLQSFPTPGSFQTSQLFASGGQNIGVSVSTSVLPMNTQDWSSLGWTGWIVLQSKRLPSLLQHHSSKASILQCSAFFIVQLAHPYMTTGENHSHPLSTHSGAD